MLCGVDLATVLCYQYPPDPHTRLAVLYSVLLQNRVSDRLLKG